MFLALFGCHRTSLQQLYDDAHLQLQQGYYEKVIPEATEGIRRSTPNDPLWSWKFRLVEAEALMRRGQVKQSLDVLAEDPSPGLPIEIRGRKKIVQAQALCRSDRNKEGMALLDQAEKLISGSAVPLQAELTFNRGYCSFNSPAAAQSYFQKAAELAHASDPFLVAASFGNIGSIVVDEGHYDEAIEWFQKALPLMKAANSPLIEEKLLRSLGWAHSELGDFRGAIEYLERALAVTSQLGRIEEEQYVLVDLGRAYQSLPGEYSDKAEFTYRRALSISAKLNNTALSNACLHNLAQLALSEHNLNNAKSYWKQLTANLSPGGPGEENAWLDEAEIATGEKDFDNARKIFERIGRDPRTGIGRRALAESWLAQVYWKQHKPADAERTFQQSIHTVEEELAKTKEQYWASILDNHSHRFDNYTRFLVDQGQFMRALDQVEYQRQLGLTLRLAPQRSPLNIAAIQRRLARNQVILDYHVTDEESFLWVITAKHVQLFHLPSHPELHYLLEAHTNEIQGQRAIEDSPGGQKLYKALVQPAEKLIPSGAQVSIIPSKILWLLNFETLIVPGPRPHYWIEDVAIQNWSSLSRAATPAVNSQRSGKQMLLIGAPQAVNPTFPPLKHASEEIGEIKSQFVSDHEQVISGSAATPQAYLSSAPEQYRFIHFVTHGIPNEKIPMESAIVLSGTTSSYKLYARDIVAKPIHADLVTISACYGAGKRWYVAEGVVGLGWAFIRAGAHQVIAALWEVDDSTTPELMNNLYMELNRHHTAADALRSAKLAMLHASGPQKLPYYWGSLQLYTRS